MLTIAEKNQLKEHPIISASIAKPFGFNDSVIEIIKHHHEKVDGTGYPSKLKEEDIPYGSKIIGLCEFFIEITNDSPRQTAIPIKEAIKTIQRLSGLHFSKDACKLLQHAYSL